MSGDRSPAYQHGYVAYRHGQPMPPCPYSDRGEALDWERGYWDAHADRMTSAWVDC